MSYNCCEDEKKSSGTAKTALGLGIAGLSLAAVNGGLFGGDGYGNGGLLGGLFGGNRNGRTEEIIAHGRKAQTELDVVNHYMIPTWHEISELKKDVAINRTLEMKNQEINHLLFKRAEEQSFAGFELNKLRTEAAFALADQKQKCCCDKTNDRISYVSALREQQTNAAFALADQKANSNFGRLASDINCVYDKLDRQDHYNRDKLESDLAWSYRTLDKQDQCNFDKATTNSAWLYKTLDNQDKCNYDKVTTNSAWLYKTLDNQDKCNYDKLSADLDCTYKRLDAKTDSAFTISGLQTDIKIGEATKNVVRGKVYLSPCSMAEPFAGGVNVLYSRHITPFTTDSRSTGYQFDCGNSGGYNW